MDKSALSIEFPSGILFRLIQLCEYAQKIPWDQAKIVVIQSVFYLIDSGMVYGAQPAESDPDESFSNRVPVD